MTTMCVSDMGDGDWQVSVPVGDHVVHVIIEDSEDPPDHDHVQFLLVQAARRVAWSLDS